MMEVLPPQFDRTVSSNRSDTIFSAMSRSGSRMLLLHTDSSPAAAMLIGCALHTHWAGCLAVLLRIPPITLPKFICLFLPASDPLTGRSREEGERLCALHSIRA